MIPGSREASRALNDLVEAYEAALGQGEEVLLGDFLPPTDHPLRGAVLGELIRVDLENGWEQGRPKSVEEYLEMFPELKGDADAVRAIAFEEYRLRQQAGEDPSADVYQDRYGGGGPMWRQPRPDRSPEPAPTRKAVSPFLDFSPPGESSRDTWPSSVAEVAGPEAWRPPTATAADPEVTYLLAQALTALPGPGSQLAGFHLDAELGRGAFGRVYLARQGHLANRPVALKISVDLFGESQTLAQLQHTNIVPIYSVHQAGPFQAVCMPYFGPTTLADVLQDLKGKPLPTSGKTVLTTLQTRRERIASQGRTGSKTDPAGAELAKPVPLSPAGGTTATLEMLAGLTYVQAVLWIGERLADGLAHAHERGILHLDLKPANILVTDEGQPMLVDFNLSTDTKRRGGAAGALVGGTLPYMSPEQLEAFQGQARPVDSRSDLYSLGVILYELLTGRLPFEVENGPLPEVLPRMLQSRLRAVAPMRQFNKAVTPAVASIVRHCLEQEPGRRYQSAQQLRDDLHCQLEHLSLRYAAEPSLIERGRKWVRRHPRLASPATFGALVAIALGIVVIPMAWQKWQDFQEEEERSKAEQKLARGGLKAAQEREKKAEEQRKKAKEKEAKAEIEKVIARQITEAWNQLGEHQLEMLTLSRLEDRLNRWELLHEPGLADVEDLKADVNRARKVLSRYDVLKNKAWQDLSVVKFLPDKQRAQLPKDIGHLLYLLARETQIRVERLGIRAARGDRDQIEEALRLNSMARACFAGTKVPPLILRQKESLKDLLGRKVRVRAITPETEEDWPQSARGLYERGYELASRQEYRLAAKLLRKATRLAPQNFSAWLVLALCHHNLTQVTDAASSFSICIALEPDFLDCHFDRGKTYIRLREWALARADFDKVIQGITYNLLLKCALGRADFDKVVKAQQGLARAYTERANAWHGLKNYQKAVADYTTALKLRPGETGNLFLRARARKALGDEGGANKDLEEIGKSTPTTAEGWTYRGLARSTANPAGALADFDRALARDPRGQLALYRKAQILSNLKGRGEEAAGVLDVLVSFYPYYVEARAKRALFRAYLGKRRDAHEDAEECLRREPTSAMQYEAGRVYALTSRTHPEDRKRAFLLLFSALRNGFGSERVEKDPHLTRLHEDRDFILLLEVARALAARGSEQIP